GHALLAKIKNVAGLLAAMGDVLRAHVGQRLAGTHGGAHGAFARRSAVVAHVALHHLLVLGNFLGNAEGAGQHAVPASDAARLERGVHHPIFTLLDGIGGTDLGASGIVAVPANVSRCADGLAAVNEVEVDHGLATVGLALLASLHARLAADTARRVHVKFVAKH